MIARTNTGKFNPKNEGLGKCLGYFEIVHIDNPCILTIACNPKEYFEISEGRDINKKHKEIKKGSSNLGFENLADRLN